MNEERIARLTDRQKDCLRLVGQGFTSKEIGRLLDLSPSTVDNHVTTAVQALAAANRGSAARALSQYELGQKLPRQPEPLVPQSHSPHAAPHPEAVPKQPDGDLAHSLPPVGGKRNDLDGASRTLRILQVAIVAAITVIALTILISGLFRTFG